MSVAGPRGPPPPKRSSNSAPARPSVLVTDTREARPAAAPNHPGAATTSASAAASARPQPTRQGTRVISVDRVLAQSSDIPSAQRRGPPGARPAVHTRTPSGRHPLDPKLRGVGVPLSGGAVGGSGVGGGAGAYLPARSSKLSEKLVLLPETSEEGDGEEKEDGDGEGGSGDSEDDVAPPSDAALARRRERGSGGKGKSEAERLPKSQRAQLARVTAYCTAQSYRLRSTAQFVRERHGARTKIYEDCLYGVYQLPLLGGVEGYRVRSSPVVKNPGGKSVLDEQIEANERRTYREGWRAERDEYSVRGGEGEGYAADAVPDSDGAKEGEHHEAVEEQERQDEHDAAPQQQQQDEAESEEQRRTNGWKEGDASPDPADRRNSETLSFPSPQPTISPDAYHYAELFVFSYGVAVLWNFTPGQEKDLLADLTFSSNLAAQQAQPVSRGMGRAGGGGGGGGSEDKARAASGISPFTPASSHPTLSLKAAALAPASTTLPLMTRPLDEDDFETEEFHFQYSSTAEKPRIYNDMITLRTSDHMIKLAMSYAIAQSTKLSFFEERMQRTMSEAQYVPRRLALEGRLGMSRREVVSLVGRLFEGRVDVNLSSNMLDTPNFFWDSEPTLHPLYAAVREYLEIRPRIQVLNERCRVFLDLAEILSDSIADVKMTRITWIIIVLIVLSIAVTCTEVVLRFAILAKSGGSGKGGKALGVGGMGEL
ncbi:Sad1-interacting factor 3 [Teratosphaeriaceae sp. CCFEE 6253]|nr:Sad1-interacting factor 3 [Teratosphaeriaceae sp. CCFEE 6253]